MVTTGSRTLRPEGVEPGTLQALSSFGKRTKPSRLSLKAKCTTRTGSVNSNRLARAGYATSPLLLLYKPSRNTRQPHAAASRGFVSFLWIPSQGVWGVSMNEYYLQHCNCNTISLQLRVSAGPLIHADTATNVTGGGVVICGCLCVCAYVCVWCVCGGYVVGMCICL